MISLKPCLVSSSQTHPHSLSPTHSTPQLPAALHFSKVKNRPFSTLALLLSLYLSSSKRISSPSAWPGQQLNLNLVERFFKIAWPQIIIPTLQMGECSRYIVYPAEQRVMKPNFSRDSVTMGLIFLNMLLLCYSNFMKHSSASCRQDFDFICCKQKFSISLKITLLKVNLCITPPTLFSPLPSSPPFSPYNELTYSFRSSRPFPPPSSRCYSSFPSLLFSPQESTQLYSSSCVCYIPDINMFFQADDCTLLCDPDRLLQCCLTFWRVCLRELIVQLYLGN